MEEGPFRRKLKEWRERKPTRGQSSNPVVPELEELYKKLTDIERYILSPGFRERPFEDALHDGERIFRDLKAIPWRVAELLMTKKIDRYDYSHVSRGAFDIMQRLVEEFRSILFREIERQKADLYSRTREPV